MIHHVLENLKIQSHDSPCDWKLCLYTKITEQSQFWNSTPQQAYAIIQSQTWFTRAVMSFNFPVATKIFNLVRDESSRFFIIYLATAETLFIYITTHRERCLFAVGRTRPIALVCTYISNNLFDLFDNKLAFPRIWWILELWGFTDLVNRVELLL